MTTPFNVTGGPALAQCIGFGSGGLPLSMQIVGRPFDEATVLRAGDGFNVDLVEPFLRLCGKSTASS